MVARASFTLVLERTGSSRLLCRGYETFKNVFGCHRAHFPLVIGCNCCQLRIHQRSGSSTLDFPSYVGGYTLIQVTDGLELPTQTLCLGHYVLSPSSTTSYHVFCSMSSVNFVVRWMRLFAGSSSLQLSVSIMDTMCYAISPAPLSTTKYTLSILHCQHLFVVVVQRLLYSLLLSLLYAP